MTRQTAPRRSSAAPLYGEKMTESKKTILKGVAELQNPKKHLLNTGPFKRKAVKNIKKISLPHTTPFLWEKI
jgi:hypothetical protein